MGDEHPEEAKLEKSNASPGVASGKSERASSKRQRAEERRRVARRRELRKRSIRIALVAVVIFVPALWGFDMSANEEIVDAVVIQTQRYSHYNERSGTHFHLRATILVDVKSEQQSTRADGARCLAVCPMSCPIGSRFSGVEPAASTQPSWLQGLGRRRRFSNSIVNG